MIALGGYNFHHLLTQGNSKPDAQVVLLEGQQGLATRSGMVQWFKGKFSTSKNRAVHNLFLNSIKASYGGEIAEDVFVMAGLDDAAAKGAPLRSREVRKVLSLAETFKGKIQSSNEKALKDYLGDSEPPSQNLFRARFKAIAGKYLSQDKARESEARCDVGRITKNIQEAASIAGQSGTRFVESAEVVKIAEASIRDNVLKDTYRNHIQIKMNLGDPQSIAAQSMQKALDDSSLQNLDLLAQPNMRTQLQNALNDKVHFRFGIAMQKLTSGQAGAEKLDQIFSDAKIKAIVDAFAQQALPKYTQALQAMQQNMIGIEVSPQVAAQFHKAAMEGLVLSAEKIKFLAPHVQACTAAMSTLEQGLGQGTHKAQQEQIYAPLQTLHEAFVQDNKGTGIKQDERTTQFTNTWKFLLQNKTPEQLKSLAQAMSANSAITTEAFTALDYFANAFSTSEAYAKKPELYAQGTSKAQDYHLMMQTLTTFLEMETGVPALSSSLKSGMTHQSFNQHTDVLMRNLGIQTPRVTGIGLTESDISIPKKNLDAIKREIGDMQLLKAREMKFTPDGILSETERDFGRAVYRVGGREYPAASEHAALVSQAFKDICTDENGTLNKELLLGICKYAYQRLQGGVMTKIWDFNDPEKALILGLPELHEAIKVYDIKRTEDGGAIIRSTLTTPSSYLTVNSETGMEPVMLDSTQSRTEMNIEVRLDSRGENPQLTDIKLGFLFIPKD